MTKDTLDRANEICRQIENYREMKDDINEYSKDSFDLYATCGDGVRDYVASLPFSCVYALLEFIDVEIERLRKEFEEM